MQRLELNQSGYFGERIDLEATLADCVTAAERHGWEVEAFPAGDLKLFALHRPAPERDGALRRSRAEDAEAPPVATPVSSAPAAAGTAHRDVSAVIAKRIYLSAGMHGDEPAGPLAARRLLEDNIWPDAELWLLPCLNPDGLRANTRANADGLDINRDYRHFRTPEARGHVAWLQRQPPFDLTLLLHEDWEAHGFYCYELNPDGQPSLAEVMVEAIRPFCPIDASEVIDGRPASRPGILRPQEWPDFKPQERPEWPEAIWLGVNQTRHNYTLEAPSDWPLALRVNALVVAVRAAMERCCADVVT